MTEAERHPPADADPVGVEQPRKLRSFGVYWPMAVTFTLAAMVWIPYVFPAAVVPPQFVAGWGASATSPPQLYVTANGYAISDRDARKHKFVAVAFHYYGRSDIRDADRLQKSGLFDIRNEQVQLWIQPDEQFMAEVLRGDRLTHYTLLLVPSETSTDKFSTLRQAESLGARVLWRGAGPP